MTVCVSECQCQCAIVDLTLVSGPGRPPANTNSKLVSSGTPDPGQIPHHGNVLVSRRGDGRASCACLHGRIRMPGPGGVGVDDRC